MADVASRLAQLVPHWLEHGEAHAQSYRQWAERAREAGMEAVAEALDEVLRATEEAHGALRRAGRELDAFTK